ncbi:phage tail protein [Oceanobacillus damuensis]|uniref:phage tail protein n=1 Tax=Oceanobacillus damuensis TaxID=937928 RepID=UPI000831C946|nr:hypothetical protein [Oceanobacillus damuensis]
MQIFKLFGSILIDDKEAQNSLSKTDKKAKGVGERLGGGIKTAAKWGTALAGAAIGVGAAMFGLANKATQTADAIAKGAEKLGVTTDFYQEMDFWASQNGLSHDNMEKAIGRFNQRLGKATNGNEKYSEALKELGVNLDDVKDGTLSTEDAFAQSISTLSEMENEQDKVNLATEMFGTKLARNLLPALNDGSLSIDEAREKAQELGLVLEEDSLYAAEAFQDSWDRIKRSLGTAATQIGLDLMPMFQSLMDWVISNLPAIRETFSNVFGFIQTATGWVTDGIGKVIGFLKDWATQNEGSLSSIWEGFQTYLGLLLAYWSMVFGTVREVLQEVLNFIVPFVMETLIKVVEFWKQNGQAILENAVLIFNSVKETIMTALQAAWVIIQEVLNIVVPFIQEKLAVLRQFWEENGQQIMQAVQNAFSFIQSVIEFVMPAVMLVVRTVLDLIMGLFNGALNIIMGLIKTFSGLFTGDWSKMWEGIKQLLSGALQFVWNLINLTLIGRGLALIRSFASVGVNLIRGLGTNIMNIFRNIGSSVTGTVSNLISRVLGFFRNMGSGIRSAVRGIFTNIKSTFSDILSFVTGLGSSFLSAGKGLIDQMAKGIKEAATKVIDSVKDIAGSVRDFLPFSPAKVGPLSDLDKLDFGGPIEDSIDKSEGHVKRSLEHLLTIPDKPKVEDNARTTVMTNQGNPESDSRRYDKDKFDLTVLEELLLEVIRAIREGKNIILNDKVIAKETGDARAEDDGKRVRHTERRLAT